MDHKKLRAFAAVASSSAAYKSLKRFRINRYMAARSNYRLSSSPKLAMHFKMKMARPRIDLNLFSSRCCSSSSFVYTIIIIMGAQLRLLLDVAQLPTTVVFCLWPKLFHRDDELNMRQPITHHHCYCYYHYSLLQYYRFIYRVVWPNIFGIRADTHIHTHLMLKERTIHQETFKMKLYISEYIYLIAAMMIIIISI